MLTTTKQIPHRVRRALLEVAPDHALVPFRFKCTASTAAELLREIESATAGLSDAAQGASVELEGYSSQTQKLGGKGLFGAGVRTAANVTGRVVLSLDPEASFMSRMAAVEELRARLESVKLSDGSLALGECRFAVLDRDGNRAAACEALRARVERMATACGMIVHRLETAGDLTIEIAGPCAAFVSLDATVEFRAAHNTVA